MAEADALRMTAEVVDKFSAPLRNLRTQLQSIRGPESLKQIEAGAMGVEKAVAGAGRSIGSVLNPALAAIGVTGLGVTGVLVGLGNVLRSFSTGTVELTRLGRETGIAAGQLRELQALGSKAGVAPEAMANGLRSFAERMRDIRRGVGDVSGWLNTQNPLVAQLAKELRGSTDNVEAFNKALDFAAKNIPNATDRRRFLEQLGLRDLAQLADEGPEAIRRYREGVARELAKLPPDAEKNAKALEDAFSSIKLQLRSLGDAIGSDLAPKVQEMVSGLSEFVQTNRAEIGDNLSKAITAIADALKAVPWKDAGEGFLGFLRGVAEYGGKAVEVARNLRSLLDSAQAGDMKGALGALRRLDGADGPLARGLAPQEGDREKAIQERLAQLRQSKDWNDKLPQRPGFADQDEKLRAEIKRLTDELEKLRTGGGATAQPSAFDGSGGVGAMIHRASLGGSMSYGRGALRSYGGAGAGGGGAAIGSGVPRISPRAGGPGEAVRGGVRSLFGLSGEGANPGAYKDVLDHIARTEGTEGRGGYNASLAYGKLLPGGKDTVLTGKTLDEIDALQTGMLKHPDNRWNSSAIGRYQIVRTTLRSLRRRLGLTGDQLFDEGMQDRLGAELAKARGPNAAGLAAEWESLRGDKLAKAVELMRRVPAGSGTTPGQREAGGLRGLWPNGWKGAAVGGEQPDWSTGAARNFDAFRNSRMMMDQASRLGVGGGQSVSGSVNVNVEKPGPSTTVRTSSDGPLFREVRLNRGRSMTLASEVA